MKKIGLVIAALVASIALSAAPVYAAEEACENWDKKDPNYSIICGADKNKGEKDAKTRVSNILNTVFLWAGIVAVIVIVIGGVMYGTSQGDTSKVQRGKAVIISAVIGLIVVVLAFAIVTFIIDGVNEGV